MISDWYMKCRRCEKHRKKEDFAPNSYICRLCKKRASAKRLNTKDTNTRASIKKMADDIVRQFQKGSKVTLVCAVRDLVKYYEQHNIDVEVTGKKESEE